MAEESTDAETDEGGRPLAGERLGIARRDQDISLRDIAKELHLDEAKVQAIEQNRFESLGAPVFAKGHLRKYAEIVGLDASEVVADYDQIASSQSEPPIVGAPRDVSSDIDLTRYIVPAVVLLLLLLAIVVWLRAGSPLPSFDRVSEAPDSQFEIQRPVATEPVVAADAPVESEPDMLVADEPAPDAPDAPDAAEAADEVATGPDESVESEPVAAVSLPSGPQVSVELTFTGNCWTEVTDADGQRLFFDLGSDGRSVVVSGSAPLRVLFGSYENVSLVVNGTDYPIPASARRGETARFTINAP